jgi:hypothetical protein
MTDNTAGTPVSEPGPAESTAIDASLPTAPAPAPVATEPASADSYYTGDYDPTNLPPAQPNLAVGIVAGIVLGVIAALVFAGVTVFSGNEYLALGVLIGAAIAFGFHRFGHTRGIIPALIAAVVTGILYLLAVLITAAGLFAKEVGGTFIDALRLVVENASEVISIYFEDKASLAFLGVSVAMAAYYAFGGRRAKS